MTSVRAAMVGKLEEMCGALRLTRVALSECEELQQYDVSKVSNALDYACDEIRDLIKQIEGEQDA